MLTAVGLLPSPRSCGNTNQIQWLRLPPLRQFAEDGVVDAILRVDEALQVESIMITGISDYLTATSLQVSQASLRPQPIARKDTHAAFEYGPQWW